MDESSYSPSDSSNDRPEGEVTQEFQRLGDNLRDILRTAWESPERKRLQSEISAGLAELVNSLDKAAREARESPTGQRIEAEVKDLRQRVRSGEVEADLREDILSLLRKLNSRLEKATEPGTDKEAETAGTEDGDGG